MNAPPPVARIGAFKRYLTAWIAAAIVFGLAIGSAAPAALAWLHVFEVGQVNLAIAVLVWLMIFPTMVKVDLSKLANGRHFSKGLAVTVTTNWLIKPLAMSGLATLFLSVFFSSWVPPDDARGYIAGLILLGAAPCTGMVFVWSRLAGGDAAFTVAQVAINDLILVVAFAPLVGLLLGVADVGVPFTTLAWATGVFVILPLAAGAVARRRLLRRGGAHAVERFATRFDPLTSSGLLLLVALLFGLQAEAILAQPAAVCLIAVPLLVQAYGIFGIAYGWARQWGLPNDIAAPAALIGTSNFFELAIAVAIGLFGLDSPAALATVVGVLIEVPVMLSLVSLLHRLQGRASRPEVAFHAGRA